MSALGRAIDRARIDERCRVTDRLDARHGRLYFAVQALMGLVWWIGVFTVPLVRELTLGGLDPVVVAAIDIPLFVFASALVALGVRWAVWVAVPWTVLVTLGMAGYATISGEAGWGAVLMIAAAAASVAAGLLVVLGRLPAEWIIRGPFAFRLARPGRPATHVRRTGVQLVLFWGLFLVVLPLVIAFLERRWQLDVPVPIAVPIAGVALLAAASALGIWSALAMSTLGEGTAPVRDGASPRDRRSLPLRAESDGGRGDRAGCGRRAHPRVVARRRLRHRRVVRVERARATHRRGGPRGALRPGIRRVPRARGVLGAEAPPPLSRRSTDRQVDAPFGCRGRVADPTIGGS